MPETLSDWLDRLERLHPSEIELGLDRVGKVADTLSLRRPSATVISVAGTNGKGSCCAVIDAVLRTAGMRTGVYTSPHLLQFNERICVDGVPVTDTELCVSFATVEAARGDTSLTYFEYSTLAALQIFAERNIDVAILEVGLGGRLDAVNLVDADVAVITSVARDHVDWLGEDLNGIASEKAGIMRSGAPLVYGQHHLHDSVSSRAEVLGTCILRRGHDYDLLEDGAKWTWQGTDSQGRHRQCADLPRPGVLVDNAATALQSLLAADLLPDEDIVRSALSGLSLRGRMQRARYHGVPVLLDVAHNPAAAERLAQSLASTECRRPVISVFAVMGDKDFEGMLQVLAAQVDRWVFADLPEVHRAASASALLARAEPMLDHEPRIASNIGESLDIAAALAGKSGCIVVCGSFFTVAAALQLIDQEDDGDGNSNGDWMGCT